MEIALTIAGSDSGGGAGIQADLKTFHQFGVYGTSVITAITAQNTKGVLKWSSVDPEMVGAQLKAVLSDLPPRAIKSGMIPTAAVASEIARVLRDHRVQNYVLDPVMMASSGDSLMDPDAIDFLKKELFPLAAIATPNLQEAGALLGSPVASESEMRDAAKALAADLGVRSVLVKGGHLPGDREIIDVYYDGEFEVFRHARIGTTSTHGTGCTLSAAIAAQLARGITMRNSVGIAIDFVHRAIASAPGLGSGQGPLDHFVSPAT